MHSLVFLHVYVSTSSGYGCTQNFAIFPPKARIFFADGILNVNAFYRM